MKIKNFFVNNTAKTSRVTNNSTRRTAENFSNLFGPATASIRVQKHCSRSTAEVIRDKYRVAVANNLSRAFCIRKTPVDVYRMQFSWTKIAMRSTSRM